MAHRITARDTAMLALLALAAITVHGYHVGVEDQAIYLPAIKSNLDPSLFPHDSVFFLSQTRWTLFDELVALLVRVSRLPVEWALLLVHALAVFGVLLGSLRVARRCFAEPAAQWGGVALVAALLTLPVAGTLVLLADPYLHPRVIATALAMFALADILDKRLRALLWLALGMVMHPQATVFAVAHLLFQVWWTPPSIKSLSSTVALPLLQGDAWREVMLTRRHHFPLRWTWYEWLGAVGPVILLGWFARIARKANHPVQEHVAGRLAFSCALGTIAALTLNLVPALERFMPAQPMRHLHLVYVLLFLLAGGLIAQKMLRGRSALRAGWLLLIVAVMFYAQRHTFSASPHLELPGLRPRNEWLELCAWVRSNTPRDSFFALDPRYMESRGVDHHGFRGLAERSMLADSIKDRGVAAIFLSVADRWKREVDTRRDWRVFQRKDFLRLQAEFGVNWVVLERQRIGERQIQLGFPCPYSNSVFLVCRVE